MENRIFRNNERIQTLISWRLPPIGLATAYFVYSFSCQTAFTKESLDQHPSYHSQSEICQCLDDWPENTHNNSPSSQRIPIEPGRVTEMAGNNFSSTTPTSVISGSSTISG